MEPGEKVLVGLVVGVVFGLGLQLVYGSDNPVLKESISWFNIVGNGYVQLLQMIVMPLVFASILSAVAKLHNASSLGKISVLTIGTLLFTTLISALVGVLVTNLFGLTAEGLVQGAQESARLTAIQTNYVGKLADLTVPQMVLSFIPKNPFADLTGASPTSIISVVIFATFLGVASLQLLKDDKPKGERALVAIDTLQAWVMKLVRLVMKLTPYGVLALMTKVVAGSNIHDIVKLGSFVVASYIGLAIMFVVHAVLLAFTGVNPMKFFRKVWPVITFAFTSRSSAASIPLNVEAQTRRLGVPESIASFSASFGATIGQNGCAGLYPAMLAVMVAPTVGINPLDPVWIATLVGIVTISSAGVAGVRRRHLRRADRAAGDGPAGDAGRAADLGRTADRHGPYRAERQRLHGGRHHHQPADEANRQSRDGQRRRSRIGSPLTPSQNEKTGNYPRFLCPLGRYGRSPFASRRLMSAITPGKCASVSIT